MNIRKTAKFFIILGMMFGSIGIFPVILGIFALRNLNRAEEKCDTIAWGIVTTIFVSLIGGIFMLCIPEKEFKERPLATKKTKSMKNNNLIFAILSFIVIACFFIYIGSIITSFSANYPGHEASLFIALLSSYYPQCVAILSAMYFVKYMIECDYKTTALHIINLSRAYVSVWVFYAWLFKYFLGESYYMVNTTVGAIILALFAAELVIWLVSLKKKNA